MIVDQQFFYQNKYYLLITTVLFFIITYHFFSTRKELADITNHIIPIIIILSTAVLGLKVTIEKEKIAYQWIWLRLIKFQKNVITANNIQEIKIVKYNFFEGGLGYGIRYSRKYGTIHSVSGNIGLALKTNKSRILLGIQRRNAIKELLTCHYSSVIR